MAEVVRMWKGYQTKRHGIAWQEGFFDHRIRSKGSEEEKADYIRMNPVRAGLVTRPENWPYVLPASAHPSARPEDSPYL